MRKLIIAIACFGFIGCSSAALPAAPTVVAALDTEATQLRLTAGTRSDGRLNVVAQLLTAHGGLVAGQSVASSSTSGAMTPATAATDASGEARSIVDAIGWATLSARAEACGCADTIEVLGRTIAAPVTSNPPPAAPPVVVTVPPNIPDPLVILLSGGAERYAYADDQQLFGLVRQDLSVTVTGWDFGDGVTWGDNSPLALHTFSRPGTFLVVVTVRDSIGRAASASQRVIVTVKP